MSVAPRSASRTRLLFTTKLRFTSSSTPTMSTRNLPTPPPEGPVPPTEAGHTAPPTTGAEEATAPADQPPAQPQQVQIHTIYREVFPIFANKAIDKDWSGLAMFAELHDLRVRRGIHASSHDLLISLFGIYRQSMTPTYRGCCSQFRLYCHT